MWHLSSFIMTKLRDAIRNLGEYPNSVAYKINNTADAVHMVVNVGGVNHLITVKPLHAHSMVVELDTVKKFHEDIEMTFNDLMREMGQEDELL